MKLTEEIYQAITTSEHFRTITNYLNQSKCDFILGDIDSASVIFNKYGADVYLNINSTYVLNGENTNTIEQFVFKVGLSTPKGYFSAKKMPITIVNTELLLESELLELMKYFDVNTKKNTFDPFFFENNIKRNNASAWAYIANNYMQDDCR